MGGSCFKLTLVLASGAVVDTSSAFVNPTLGTKKDDPKAKYTLLAHAIETFEGASVYDRADASGHADRCGA